jgi:hypothetical protein
MKKQHPALSIRWGLLLYGNIHQDITPQETQPHKFASQCPFRLNSSKRHLNTIYQVFPDSTTFHAKLLKDLSSSRSLPGDCTYPTMRLTKAD